MIGDGDYLCPKLWQNVRRRLFCSAGDGAADEVQAPGILKQRGIFAGMRYGFRDSMHTDASVVSFTYPFFVLNHMFHLCFVLLTLLNNPNSSMHGIRSWVDRNRFCKTLCMARAASQRPCATRGVFNRNGENVLIQLLMIIMFMTVGHTLNKGWLPLSTHRQK